MNELIIDSKYVGVCSLGRAAGHRGPGHGKSRPVGQGDSKQRARRRSARDMRHRRAFYRYGIRGKYGKRRTPGAQESTCRHGTVFPYDKQGHGEGRSKRRIHKDRVEISLVLILHLRQKSPREFAGVGFFFFCHEDIFVTALALCEHSGVVEFAML